MSTLLLRLAAPIQSWGINAKFERRSTERKPTKSGVLGLVAAALGRQRNECIDDLKKLRFGVRIDREGVLLRDYHTAIRTVGKTKTMYVTNRYYISDAIFLAGLEGNDEFLSEIETALRYPVYPLFLGRRSCPPEGKLCMGIRVGKTLLEALKEEPLQAETQMQYKENSEAIIHISMDAAGSDTDIYFQRDLPVSFDPGYRKYSFRRVKDYMLRISTNDENFKLSLENPTAHDPMLELEEE